MKLIILLSVVAWSNGAKLDRAYLPPSNAQSSGGSSFLQTPVSDFSRGSSRNFAQGGNAPGFTQKGFEQQTSASFGQGGNNFAQGGNTFTQGGNFAPGANNFGPTGNNFAQGNAAFNFEARPERAQAALERNAAILRFDNQNDGESYAYAFETENGITAEENGVATNGVEAQGGYSYTGDDGQVYSVRYTADQNGFVPQGDHLPTPPPVPEEILRALEQNARDEAAGIFDDGSYNEAKYGGGADNNQYNNNYGDNGNNFNAGNTGNNFNAGNNGNNFNAGNNGNNFNAGSSGNTFAINDNGEDEDTVVTNNALLRSSQPAFRNQASSFSNQGSAIGFRGQAGNQAPSGFRNQAPGFNNQGSAIGFRGQAGNQAPSGFRSRDSTAGFRNQPSAGGFRNQGNQATNRAYLPPNQRSEANGFGRRQPSFGAEAGYQY